MEESGHGDYARLRGEVLAADPADRGLRPPPDGPHVWGVVFDLGMEAGTATLAVLADGTTSLWTSTGSGVVGGGAMAYVADPSRRLLDAAARLLDACPPGDEPDLPAAGEDVVRVLTHGGRREARVPDAVLGGGGHPLSPVYAAAHEVLARLRVLEQARGTG